MSENIMPGDMVRTLYSVSLSRYSGVGNSEENMAALVLRHTVIDKDRLAIVVVPPTTLTNFVMIMSDGELGWTWSTYLERVTT